MFRAIESLAGEDRRKMDPARDDVDDLLERQRMEGAKDKLTCPHDGAACRHGCILVTTYDAVTGKLLSSKGCHRSDVQKQIDVYEAAFDSLSNTGGFSVATPQEADGGTDSTEKIRSDAPRMPKEIERKATNPKDAVATSKLDLTLMPDTAIAYGNLAFTEGALKYGAYNWRVAGVRASVYLSALKRHVAKYENGEWADQKTRVPHLASALACLSVLIDAHECDMLNDDRPPRADMALVLENFQAILGHLQKMFPDPVPRNTQAGEKEKNTALMGPFNGELTTREAHNPKAPEPPDRDWRGRPIK